MVIHWTNDCHHSGKCIHYSVVTACDMVIIWKFAQLLCVLLAFILCSDNSGEGPAGLAQ